MFRRAMTLIVAAALLVGFAVAGLFLRVPYLVASPGLALNTLDEHDGERIIGIEGRESYEHEGGLSMVTVQYAGGPDHRMDLFTALSAWLSPNQAVLPEEVVFPPDRSVEEITENQTLQMDSSQETALAAALNELEIDYETAAVVAGVSEGMPAEGLLETGDLITRIDGEAVADKAEAVEEVQDREPGDPVELTVSRDGETEEVVVESAESEEGDPVIGVLVGNDLEFPFEVDISVGEIGGPSAGMMFALGIMDRLSPEGLTGGHTIAGTGTIDVRGDVGGVSGVQQKMVSAQRQGAEYFFVAAESCSQTFDSAATGEIEVVKIEELGDAVDALESIRTGTGLDELPRC
ncbi:PDZ domain-containing protein [Spinactinospora alkalitolerans]|uniref:PDZ domain-containing protein n=1 Tax=Spinactinospora alkalitolerans TaxID=687207 RepID=A0A852TSP9_9ACTN|nr:PDZ domain-containing protein [Spinactinospora alkalitolerans]NYE45763.1 PDZ domain-containing protein [Spinactinospora alkalitolerans]